NITRLAFSVYRSNMVPSPRMLPVTSAKSILLFPWSERRAFQEEACKLGGQMIAPDRPPNQKLPYLSARGRPKRLFEGSAALRCFTLAIVSRAKALTIAHPQPKMSFPLCASRRKRLGRNLLDPALMQAQHAVTTTREVKIMGNDKGGQPVFAM